VDARPDKIERIYVMEIDTSPQWLPVYEALASIVRLNVIEHLSRKPMNIKELAEAEGLSSAIMTKHVRKLEKAGIIHAEMRRVSGGMEKLCSLAANRIDIRLPDKAVLNRPYPL
jgi:predicted transcriptional regulator